VRAFGCLLEELLALCVAPAASQPVLAKLSALKTACLDDRNANRPLFDEIERTLSDLVDFPERLPQVRQ
jgi:hypothetical protein